MVENVTESGAGQLVTAVLMGGPATFPEELRKHKVVLPCEKIKLEHYGG